MTSREARRLAPPKCYSGRKGATKKEIVEWIRQNHSEEAARIAQKLRSKQELGEFLNHLCARSRQKRNPYIILGGAAAAAAAGLALAYVATRKKKTSGGPTTAHTRRSARLQDKERKIEKGFVEEGESKRETKTETTTEAIPKEVDIKSATHVLGALRIEEWVGLGKHIYFIDWPRYRSSVTCAVKGVYPTIGQLIRHMSESNPTKTIDVFVGLDALRESDVVSTKDPIGGSLLWLYRCLQKPKPECEVPNVHVHNVKALLADVDERGLEGVNTKIAKVRGLLDSIDLDKYRPVRTGRWSTRPRPVPVSQETIDAIRDLWNTLLRLAKREDPNISEALSGVDDLSAMEIDLQLVKALKHRAVTSERLEKLIENVPQSFSTEGKATISGKTVVKAIKSVYNELLDAKQANDAVHAMRVILTRYDEKHGSPDALSVPVVLLDDVLKLRPYYFDERLENAYILARVFSDLEEKTHDRDLEQGAPFRNIVIITSPSRESRIFERLPLRRVASSARDDTGMNYGCIDIRSFPRPFFGTR